MNRYTYRGLLLFFVIFTVLSLGQPKAEAGILQIGDNAYKTIYSLDGIDNEGDVVWTAHSSENEFMNDLEIFLYSNGNTKRLTDNQVADQCPEISNGQVAWIETYWGDSMGTNKYKKIKLFDGQNTQQIAYYPEESGGTLSFDNGQLVWNNYDDTLYYYNGQNVLSRQTNGYCFPEIEEGKIVWCDADGLHLYDGNTTRTITNNTHLSFEISNGYVAWLKYSVYPSFNCDGLYLYDGNTSRIITADGSWDYNLSGNKMVWSRLEEFDKEIFYYNGQTIIKLTDNNYDDYSPQIDKGKIAWISHEGINYQIHLWDGSNSKLVINTPKYITNLLFKNGRLAWICENEIMLYEPNCDASAKVINVNGNDLVGFNSSIDTYNLKLIYGTTTVPTISATANDQNANVIVTPATALPGTTEVKITAEDGETTKTYTVNFTIATEQTDECFIATAAFGSKFEPAVVLLRHFRDQFFLTNKMGTAFVKFYYHNSPPIAAYIAQSEPLKVLVRMLLIPIIAAAYSIMHPIVGLGCIIVLGLILVTRKRSINERRA